MGAHPLLAEAVAGSEPARNPPQSLSARQGPVADAIRLPSALTAPAGASAAASAAAPPSMPRGEAGRSGEAARRPQRGRAPLERKAGSPPPSPASASSHTPLPAPSSAAGGGGGGAGPGGLPAAPPPGAKPPPGARGRPLRAAGLAAAGRVGLGAGPRQEGGWGTCRCQLEACPPLGKPPGSGFRWEGGWCLPRRPCRRRLRGAVRR